MAAYLEVWVEGNRDRVPLDGERVTIGQSPTNDLPLTFDHTVSRLHAVLEKLAAGWCVKDLASRNGTFVNGERIWGERPLHPGDEMLVGRTRLVFRVDAPTDDRGTTASAQEAPELTRREREVLLALCSPLGSDEVFKEPASIRKMAEELFVTEAAVRQHLLRLYDKFDIHEQEERRRVLLANEAVRRGAVSMAELAERAKRQRDG